MRIIIEVSGGIVINVITDKEDVDVFVVDHDVFDVSDGDYMTELFEDGACVSTIEAEEDAAFVDDFNEEYINHTITTVS